MTRVNPLVLLTVGLASLAGSLFVRSVPVGLAALAAYALVALLVLPGWRYPLVCLAFCAVGAATIAWSTWWLGGRDASVAAAAALRILVLAWPGSVAVGYLDHGRLGDYLAQVLRLPARMVAAFSAALQRVSGLSRTWVDLERVRRARGLRRSPGPMAFALVVQALRGATASAIAMDARGFATAQRRTWAEPARWSRLDVGGLVVAVALGSLPALLWSLGW